MELAGSAKTATAALARATLDEVVYLVFPPKRLSTRSADPALSAGLRPQ
jgi:hypothetical protein